jgi:homogentisate 1,2-dioxygenase
VAFYRQVGQVPRKRHTRFRRPDGGLYSEELVGEEGFSSDSSLLYHRGIPSAIVHARTWELPDQTLTPNAPLVPRHLKLHELFPEEEHKATDPVTGRRLVLGNPDVRVSYAVSSAVSPYYRNATGDECVHVERGTATVETSFGSLQVGQGDYVVLPRSTTHRWLPAGDEPLRTYVIEATSHIAPRNFVPRKVDYHPQAVPVPYYHSNVDSDEVMFYVDGDYEARKGSGIGKGSVSVHPGGHSHGPQPGAVERSLGAEFFDELAVMVDTFRPLDLGEGGTASDDGRYAWSWSGRGPVS